MIDLNELGMILKQRRTSKGITQAEMASILGLTKSHVSDIERGIHKITVQTLCSYCDALETTPDELLEIAGRDGIIPELHNYLSGKSVDEQKKVLTIAKMI